MISSQNFHDRLSFGKKIEDDVRNFLNDSCNYNLIASTLEEDKEEKTDAFDEFGRRYAIKSRENNSKKTDII